MQIGGRGKAGGIKVAKDRAAAEEHAKAILGMDIRGHTVHEVWVEAASDIASEYYASIVFDRSAKRPLVMLSTQGGMDIEEVADGDPDAIARLHVDPLLGFQDFHARRLAFEAGVDADVVRPIGALLSRLYDAFVAEEAMLVEVNPLIVTGDRQVMALDAKVTLDDNALFRHPDNAALRETEGEDPQERMARERGLTYVKLDGNVGILGNGAGLVMSTLDVVAQAGGSPANFLDAGGGSKAEAITQAVEVILSNENVTAVLFNIFGGITRCDEVAKGLIEAFAPDQPDRPLRRAPGRDQRQGGPRAAGRGQPAERAHGVDDARAPRKASSGGAGGMSILVGNDTKLCVSGITGREGTFHTLNNKRYGTNVVAGRDARQGRSGRRGHPGLQHVPRRGRRDRREHGDDLRAAALRRRLDPRGRGRRHRADRGDHRGHPGARRAARLQPPRDERRRAAGRPQLPGHPVAGQGATSASSPPPSSARATSAWCRARAR